MTTAAVEELKALTSDQPDNPLRPSQIADYHGELRRLGAMVDGRDVDGQPREWIHSDRASARRRSREIAEALAKQAPKKITGDRADKVARKAGEVLDLLKGALLPRSVMRRNPAGAVGHVLRNEFSPAFKDAAKTWKRAMRALDPDNADPDFTNLERFRAEGGGDGTSSFMADAQIPGVFAMSGRAKDNWPLGEPTADTALKQARRAATSEPKPKPKRVMTEKQREALTKAREAAAAARAEKKGAAA